MKITSASYTTADYDKSPRQVKVERQGDAVVARVQTIPGFSAEWSEFRFRAVELQDETTQELWAELQRFACAVHGPDKKRPGFPNATGSMVRDRQHGPRPARHPGELRMSAQTLLPFETTQALKFLLAGNATFTAQSEKTGTRFTYKVKRAEPKVAGREPPRLWFVSLLSGPDNENDFQYLGLIRPPYGNEDGPLAFERGVKSRVSADAPSMLAARWVIGNLLRNRPTPECSVYHEGRCGRCGRKLTVPESIVSGFGPECAQHV